MRAKAAASVGTAPEQRKLGLTGEIPLWAGRLQKYDEREFFCQGMGAQRGGRGSVDRFERPWITLFLSLGMLGYLL